MEHYINKEEYLNLADFDIGNYKDSLMNLLFEHLELESSKNKTFIDLGCGTGETTVFLNKYFKRSLGIEPFLQIEESSDSTLDFRQCCIFEVEETFDILLGKEMLHHVENRKDFFDHLYLKINEKSVFITRNENTEIPFCEKGKALFKESQPNLDSIVADIPRDKFFFRISPVDLNFVIKKENFIKLLRNRFFSNISTLTDLEIKNNIDLLPDQEILEFKDKLLILELIKRH